MPKTCCPDLYSGPELVSAAQRHSILGTHHQLIALMRKRKEKRQTEYVGWALWWDGYAVADSYWKEPLIQCAQNWDRLRQLVKGRNTARDNPELSDEFLHSVESLQTTELRAGLFSHFRKRIGRNFESAMASLFRFAFGGFQSTFLDPDSEDYQQDEKILGQALGFRRLNVLRSFGVSSWLPETIVPILVTASQALSAGRMVDVISGATDIEISLARDQLRKIFSAVSQTAAIAEKKGGTDALGLSLARRIFSTKNSKSQAYMLLGVLSMKHNPEFDAEISEFVKSLPPKGD